MTLLEVITNASSNSGKRTSASQNTIILNPTHSIQNLRLQSEDWNEASLIKPLTGWEISQTDENLLKSVKKLFSKLKRGLKNPRNFGKEDIDALLCSFLNKNAELLSFPINRESSTLNLVNDLGFTMGRDAIDLISTASIDLGHWKLLKILIINKLVGYSHYPQVIAKLVEKKRADFVCLTMRHFRGLESSEILCILRYFLSSKQDDSMVTVRKDWENAANLVLEKLTDKTTKPKELGHVKKASILIMIAYDGFSDAELCLHNLLSYIDIDDVIFSSAIRQLGVADVTSFLLYLSKWLKKYERFPQVVPPLEILSKRWLKACEWIPSLENIVKCLSYVVDEHFSSLILHSEYHQELNSVLEVVNSLASEAKLCCFMANALDNLKK